MRVHLHLTDLRFHRRSSLPDSWTLSSRRSQLSPALRVIVLLAAFLCVLAAAPAASAHSVTGEFTPVAGLAPTSVATFSSTELTLSATPITPPATPTSSPALDTAPVAIPAPAPDPRQVAIRTAIDAAISKLGSPYAYGSAGPSAFDCSGFTRWVYQQAGFTLPHYSGAQWAMVQRISLDQLQPGDLVFNWGYSGGDPDHVGLYVGDGMMIHAPSAGNRVRYDSIYWWKGAGVAAGRLP